jgi:uncharacterized protein YjbI with pentapeptide repeats
MYIKEGNLEMANFIGANLDGANLERVDLVDANLIAGNLEKANLKGASLIGANLIKANFRLQAVSKPFRFLQLGSTSFKYFFHFEKN